MVKRVRISTFDFHSCLYGPKSFACLCMKLIIFTSYNLQNCVNDIIKLYMWTCIRILFTTYKHGRAITIYMRYKISGCCTNYSMVNSRSQLLYLSILFSTLHLPIGLPYVNLTRVLYCQLTYTSYNKQKCRKRTLICSLCSPWKVYILAYFIDTSSTPQMINQYCGRPTS